MDPVLGIDFGTSKICCAVWMDNSVKLVTTESNKTMMPAYFALDNTDWVIGQEARELSTINFETSVYDLIRFFGKTVLEAAELLIYDGYCFNFGLDEDETLCFLLQHGEVTRKIPVRATVGYLIQKMKEQAEKMIDQPINKCAFTLPGIWGQRPVPLDIKHELKRIGFQEIVYFNDQEATLSGCLNKTISTHLKDTFQEYVFVVVDVGVVKTRISIASVYIAQRIFKWRVMETVPVGGRWFDQKLVEYCVEEFSKQHQLSLKDNRRAMHRLRLRCEEAKIQLSTLSKLFDINLEGLHDGKSLTLRLSSAVFDTLCGTGVQEINRCITNTIRDAGIQHTQPNLRILLVGGGSRLSLLRRLIEWSHPNSFDKSVAGYVEEAAADGAARLGARYFQERSKQTLKRNAESIAESGQDITTSCLSHPVALADGKVKQETQSDAGASWNSAEQSAITELADETNIHTKNLIGDDDKLGSDTVQNNELPPQNEQRAAEPANNRNYSLTSAKKEGSVGRLSHKTGNIQTTKSIQD